MMLYVLDLHRAQLSSIVYIWLTQVRTAPISDHFTFFTFTSLLDTTLLAKYFQSPFTDIGLQLSKATDGFISHTNIKIIFPCGFHQTLTQYTCMFIYFWLRKTTLSIPEALRFTSFIYNMLI